MQRNVQLPSKTSDEGEQDVLIPWGAGMQNADEIHCPNSTPHTLRPKGPHKEAAITGKSSLWAIIYSGCWAADHTPRNNSQSRTKAQWASCIGWSMKIRVGRAKPKAIPWKKKFTQPRQVKTKVQTGVYIWCVGYSTVLVWFLLTVTVHCLSSRFSYPFHYFS